MKKNIFSIIAISMIIATTIKAQIPTNGLVAYYPFTGNANDSSGKGNNGVVSGATLTTDRFGNSKSAYSFNGSSKITVPDSKALTVGSTLSISVWIKYNSLANNLNVVLQKGTGGGGLVSGYLVCLDNNMGQLPYYVKGLSYGNGSNAAGIDDTSSINNSWHNLIMIYNPPLGNEIYIDGMLKALYKPNTSITMTNSNNPLIIGYSTLSSPWNGQIDDIRIFNRAINNTEIQALYHEGGYDTTISKSPSDSLVAYYPFKGNALDSSGNGNNGTINGATLTTDRFGNANSAYSFNGSSSISVPNSSTLTAGASLSISVWVKYKSLANNNNLILQKGTGGGCLSTGYNFSFDNNWGAMPYDKGFNYGQNNNCAAIGDTSYLDSNWHHIVIVYNPPTGNSIFFDGILKSANFSACPTCTILNSSNPLIIGGASGAGVSWNGKIDDIRIYNKAISKSQVQLLYHEGGYSLPVAIENINAAINGNFVAVNWQTVTELNTNNIIIQRSADGTSFVDIGSEKSIGSSSNSYEFIDKNPANGNNYYRLESIDKDGSNSYSKVVSVKKHDSQSFSIVPNPASDFATICFSKAVDKAKIAVYDMTGKQIITQSLNASTNTYKLNTQTLKSGLYVIKVNTATGNYNEKLLINK